MAIQLNGVAVPSDFLNKGIWTPPAYATSVVNGQGDVVVGGYMTATWEFRILTASQFAYFETTLLAGAASARLTNNRLWNRLMAETAYSSLVLLRPQIGNYNGNRYKDVTITFTQITP